MTCIKAHSVPAVASNSNTIYVVPLCGTMGHFFKQKGGVTPSNCLALPKMRLDSYADTDITDSALSMASDNGHPKTCFSQLQIVNDEQEFM